MLLANITKCYSSIAESSVIYSGLFKLVLSSELRSLNNCISIALILNNMLHKFNKRNLLLFLKPLGPDFGPIGQLIREMNIILLTDNLRKDNISHNSNRTT